MTNAELIEHYKKKSGIDEYSQVLMGKIHLDRLLALASRALSDELGANDPAMVAAIEICRSLGDVAPESKYAESFAEDIREAYAGCAVSRNEWTLTRQLASAIVVWSDDCGAIRSHDEAVEHFQKLKPIGAMIDALPKHLREQLLTEGKRV